MFEACYVQSAVCNLLVLDTKTVELHRTEWDWSRSSTTGGTRMELGLNSREARPRWPLVHLGEGGIAAGGQAGPGVVQMCRLEWGRPPSTCRIWILEVMIKWSLNCAKGSAGLTALAFQGLRASARPRVGDGRKVAGSPEQTEQRWYLGALRLRKFTSSIRARNGEATAGTTENHSSQRRAVIAQLGGWRGCRAL